MEFQMEEVYYEAFVRNLRFCNVGKEVHVR